MKIAGILFDKDGTLFDFQKTWGKWAKVFLTEISNNNINEPYIGFINVTGCYFSAINLQFSLVASRPFSLS